MRNAPATTDIARKRHEDRCGFAFLAALWLAGVRRLRSEQDLHEALTAAIEAFDAASRWPMGRMWRSRATGRSRDLHDLLYRAMVYRCASVDLPDMAIELHFTPVDARSFLDQAGEDADLIRSAAADVAERLVQIAW